MPVLVIPCPHCAKPSRLDSDKLPDQTVRFPCPHCKGRVVVDKSRLDSPYAASATGPSATVEAPRQAAPPTDAAPPPSPSAASSGITPPAVEPTVPDRRFASLPSDAILPSGIIVGQDEPAISEIRTTLSALGSDVEHVASADDARQLIINEQPDLCIFVAGKVDAAPQAAMAPLTRLHPSIRRRLYLVLVADNLKSGDGTAAFMHEVNMVLSKQDLAQVGAALHSGLKYHQRLYRGYLEAIEAKGAI